MKAANMIIRTIRTRLLRQGPRGRRIYYRFLGKSFYREMSAVGAGIDRYDSLRMSEKDIYHLRRNVHMLEKGLVMQPRRAVFAVGYIHETVTLFRSALTGPCIESEELAWCHTVLAEYFEVTAGASDDAINVSRAEFVACQHLVPVAARMGHNGPAGPGLSQMLPLIDSDDLYKVAQARRSVRWFEPREVPESILDKAVAVAQESPTACNRQPYRFVIVNDLEVAPSVAAIPMGTAGFAHQVPAIAAVVGDLSAFFDERDRHLIYIDGSLAAMGFIFGLETQGISSCVINWPDIASKDLEIREALSLSGHEQVIMLIAFGYASPTGLSPYSAKKHLDAARTYLI